MSFRLALWCARSLSPSKCCYTLDRTLATWTAIDSPPSHQLPRQSSSKLYATPPSTYKSPGYIPQTAIGKLRQELSRCVGSGDAQRAFEICKEMKDGGHQPDITTYKHLINICSKKYLGEEAIALLDDIRNLGLSPDVEIFNTVLAAQLFNQYFSVGGLLDFMQRFGVAPNMDTYYYIMRHHANNHNLEMCLQAFADMAYRKIPFHLKTIQIIIELAANLGHARLALEIAYAFESSVPRSLQASDWMNILSASTAVHFEEGTVSAWNQVKGCQVTPNEGQCIEVLNTAGQHGLVELAVDALQALRRMQVPFQEYHLAPVLEAYCRHKMFQEAFEVIDMMRKERIGFTQDTLEPLIKCIGSDIDRIDQAWSLLEKVREDGKTVDIHSINVVLSATIHAQDLQRSVGIYKAIPNLGVKPTTETFNILLTGCINFKHRDLGEKVLSDMRESGLAPNVKTFERMIFLCLTNRPYEEAFFYLEEMKAIGFKPPRNVYVAIIRKCLFSGDNRWKIAHDEMLECGYRMDPELQKLISLKTNLSSSEHMESTGQSQEWTIVGSDDRPN